LQRFAGVCNCRIFRGVSLLRFAACCTVLRSRWYQNGINRGIAPSQSCSLAHPSEVHSAPHRGASIQLTLDRYSGTGSLGGHNTADGMDETLGQQHCVPVCAKTYAGNVRGPLPVYPVAVEHSRSRISIQHHNIWEAVTERGFAKERAPCGFEALSYARSCIQTSENSPSPKVDE
jgi:hypothetical protein